MGGTDGKGDYATVEKNEKKVNSMMVDFVAHGEW